MRTIVTILAIVVIVAIIGIATGMLNLNSSGGTLPKVAVSGGSMPKVDADVGHIDVGTKTKTVEVPDVSVQKAR